jgi:predicted ribosomally synthesized peptide with SipW-like signal peptide
MRRILFSLIALAVVIGIAGAGTFAYFSDTEQSTANTFTAGTLQISLGETSWQGTFDNLKPGDVVAFVIPIESKGTLPLNYTIKPTLSGDLAGGSNPCVVSKVLVDGVEKTAPYTDSLSAAGGADATDQITIQVTMPAAAGNEYQGKTGSLSVEIDAAQQ